jgi:transcriptional regulator GlxA family with amidase domain
VISSAEVAFEASQTLNDAAGLDQLFLLSSPVGRFKNEKSGNGALRHMARHGCVLGGISGGVFPLVRSGLMEGHKCSVHWCYEAAFREEFPDFEASDEVITLDRRRHTASGAAAAFDLALHMIEERLGEDVATEVACWFQHPLVRGQGVRQRIPTHGKSSASDMLPKTVKAAIKVFSESIATPISIAEVASAVGVSSRQMERQFTRATGKGPLHYYRSLRMNAARQLIQYSNNSMPEVAAAIGYTSTGPLFQYYKEEFGVSPEQDRAKINLFRSRDNKVVPSS